MSRSVSFSNVYTGEPCHQLPDLQTDVNARRKESIFLCDDKRSSRDLANVNLDIPKDKREDKSDEQSERSDSSLSSILKVPTFAKNDSSEEKTEGSNSMTDFPSAMSQVSIGDENIWGIRTDDITVKLVGETWIPTDNAVAINISVSSDGAVWRVLSNYTVCRFNDSKWEEIEGKLMQVAVCSSSTVFGVTPDHRLLEWSEDQMAWHPVKFAPETKQVSVASDGTLVVVTTSAEIVQQFGDDWRLIGTQLTHVAVGSEKYIVAINTANQVVQYASVNSWNLVPGVPTAISISADAGSRFWCITENNTVVKSENLDNATEKSLYRIPEEEASTPIDEDVFSEFDDFARQNKHDAPLQKAGNRMSFLSDSAVDKRKSIVSFTDISNYGKKHSYTHTLRTW
jgi:hypothetical protein